MFFIRQIYSLYLLKNTFRLQLKSQIRFVYDHSTKVKDQSWEANRLALAYGELRRLAGQQEVDGGRKSETYIQTFSDHLSVKLECESTKGLLYFPFM